MIIIDVVMDTIIKIFHIEGYHHGIVSSLQEEKDKMTFFAILYVVCFTIYVLVMLACGLIYDSCFSSHFAAPKNDFRGVPVIEEITEMPKPRKSDPHVNAHVPVQRRVLGNRNQMPPGYATLMSQNKDVYTVEENLDPPAERPLTSSTHKKVHSTDEVTKKALESVIKASGLSVDKFEKKFLNSKASLETCLDTTAKKTKKKPKSNEKLNGYEVAPNLVVEDTQTAHTPVICTTPNKQEKQVDESTSDLGSFEKEVVQTIQRISKMRTGNAVGSEKMDEEAKKCEKLIANIKKFSQEKKGKNKFKDEVNLGENIKEPNNKKEEETKSLQNNTEMTQKDTKVEKKTMRTNCAGQDKKVEKAKHNNAMTDKIKADDPKDKEAENLNENSRIRSKMNKK